MPRNREPAVAGTFYPAKPDLLARAVDELLAACGPDTVGALAPKAIIVPHAGYEYSGPVAARAYARLRALRGTVRRVVLLGPAHRAPVRGLALPGADAFVTPLGAVPVDADGVARVRTLPQVTQSESAHRLEHSLEVQLPFMQRVLGEFSLVPFAVGDATREEVADVLDALWGGAETLIVVSSDLSHYLPYDAASRIDAQTAGMIEELRGDIDPLRACGSTPVNALLLAARRRGLKVERIDLRNSGDTSGERSRVVGYGAFGVLAPADQVGASLLGAAREAIAEKFGHDAAPRDATWLQAPGATFVTLTRRGALRGCIGSLEARRALLEDVRENALGAAFRDPRFKPLNAQEWMDTQIEISLLSPLCPLAPTSEEELLAMLRPGVDGLLVEYGHHRSTFLPQVWDQIPQPREFLWNLRRKAGLPPDFFEPGFKIWRYTVARWREQGSAPSSEPRADG